MREQIILISILILWASAAHGAVSDQATGLDILGSRANNTTIIAPDGMPVEVNIVGSTASNIQIGYPTEVVNKTCGKECGDAVHAARKNAIKPHGTTSRGRYATHGVRIFPPDITGRSLKKIRYT